MARKKKINLTEIELDLNSSLIQQKPIGEIVRDAYIDFGGYINCNRHLANLDGFKVSYRRLIYTLIHNFSHTSFSHTNTAIAKVADYHPHGLSSMNDMCAALVKSGIFEGEGSFGYVQIDGEKNSPAADRYTYIKISDLYWDLMGDLLKDVPYVESPNGNPEPEYLPTPLPLCLSGDTKIRLADGRNLEISKLVEEFKSGKENYVLSCSPDGDFRMSKVIWGEKTKMTNKFIRITLDNGEIIDSTEDHLFMMRSGDYVKAENLKEGDSLMPGYFSYNSSERECIKNNYSMNNVPIYHLANMYNIEHEIYENDPEKIIIHHVDKNKDNNNPTNIIKLTRKEHSEVHKEEFIERISDPSIRAKIRESNKKYWEDPINHILAKRRWEKTADIPLENGKTPREISRENRINYNKSEEARENIRNFWKDPEKSKEALEKLQDTLKKRNSDPEFQKYAAEQRRLWLKTEEGKEFSKKNSEMLRKRNSDPEFQKKTIRGKILSQFKRLVNNDGLIFEEAYKKLEAKINKWFDSKEDFIEKEKTYNHRVEKIEIIIEEAPRDFYDITVDSRYHNFLLSAGVVVHNCLQLKTISQGLGVGISMIYPNFSAWSMYQAYIKNDPNLLEPNVDLILDKKNSELGKLWSEGKGRIIYSYKISHYIKPDDPKMQGILFETKDGTEIFTPNLKPLRKLEEEGKVYIEDLTDYDSCKMVVYRIPGARGITIEDIEALCRKCCFNATNYNLNVTNGNTAFRIPLREWIDFTYKRYIDLIIKSNQKKIEKVKFDILVQEAIPIISDYIINKNPKANDTELVNVLGIPQEIVENVMSKPISSLRKNKDNSDRIKFLKEKLKELKKFDPIKHTEEIIKKL